MQLLQISAGDLQRFLETPGELLEESEEMQIAIALFSETPRNLLEVLMESDYSAVVEVARLHVNWVGEVREDYWEVVSEVLRDKDLGENDRLAVELMRFAPVPPEFLSEWVGVNWLIQGLKNQYMPLRYRLKLLERLTNQGELEARLQVAESKETPVSILELLAGDLDLAVRLATEYNDNCPSDVIELVKSQHDLASNWDSDLEQLEELGESDWGWVRLAVAQNPYASEDVLMKLAKNEEFQIRLAVAKNPGTSAEVLNVLMGSGDSGIRGAISLGIRFAIAEHPNVTEGILLELFSTHRNVIQNRDNLPANVLERFFRETFTEGTVPWKYKYSYLLLRQPNTPTWILVELANVDLEALRAERLEQETRNNSTPGISNKWVEDDIRYLKDIAKHPQVSEEILAKLAEYPNPEVKLAVARSEITSEELKQELLEEFAVHPEENIRLELANDTNTPVHILEKIGRFEFYQTKLLREIKEILASESTVDGHSFKSTADYQMAQLKDDILFPEGISIDIESWMKILETPDLLKVLENQTTFDISNRDIHKSLNNLVPQWKKLLPNLSDEFLEELLSRFAWILLTLNFSVKHRQYSVAVKIVGNPKTPTNIREYLKNQLLGISIPLEERFSNRNVLLALAYNPQVPETERISYFQQIIANGRNYASAIAKDARTPVYLLEQLLSEREYKQDIAKNPATPEYLLRRIADECDENLWRTLAENPNTPSDLLFRFLHEKVEKKVYSNLSMFDLVIRNPGLSLIERYRLLLEKENNEIIAQVHEFMARRSHSPYALAQVVEKGNQNAKLTAARNRNTPVPILEQLARDSDETVCEAVAKNPSLPFNTLLELARNSSIRVKLSLAYKSSYGNTPPTPQTILETLAGDEDSQVRTAIASNSNVPITILEQLAKDEKIEVRRAIEENPSNPENTSESLEDDIFEPLPKQTSLTLSSLPRIYDSDNDDLATVLTEYADSDNAFVRFVTLLHPVTPGEILTQGANSAFWLQRYAIAENPETPSEVVEKLAGDGNWIVRAAANQNLSNRN